MTKYSSVSVCLAASCFLTGCLGSDNNSGTASAAAVMATTPTQGRQANRALLEAFLEERQLVTRTKSAGLPTSGSANYSGFASVALNGFQHSSSALHVVGKADLNITFASGGGMTGILSDFDHNGAVYDGTLKVSGGSISRDASEATITSKVAGTLTSGTGTAFAIKGDLSGNFWGPDGEHLNSFGHVTVRSDGKTVTGPIVLDASRK